MLKKIVDFFLKDESSGRNTTELKNVEQAADHLAEFQPSAEELVKIANQHFGSGEVATAAVYYRQALDLDPSLSSAYANLGLVSNALGKFEEAISYCDQAIALKPDFAEAYSNRGLMLNELKRFEDALNSVDCAIEFKPDLAFAHNNRGMVLKGLCRYEDAIKSYDHAISLKPDFAEAHNNRGSALNKLKRPREALESLDSAIALKPDYVDALLNKGSALLNLNRLDEALNCYDSAALIKPTFGLIYRYKAAALNRLGRNEEALGNVNQAISLMTDLQEAYKVRGGVLCSLDRFEEALSSFDKAILLKADDAEAHNNRGSVLTTLKRYDEALKSHERAIEIEPENKCYYGYLIDTKQVLCNWVGYDNSLKFLEDAINLGKNSAANFSTLCFTSSAKLQKKAAENYILADYSNYDGLPTPNAHSKQDKIRLGYFSGDFCNHAVSILISELFEKHDKTKFELIAFSLSNKKDDMTKRVSSAFDRFIDISKQSDQAVALMARELKIDIAIDLGGFTGGSRVAIFALRAAPVQVNYLGYPGTMGADFIDYIIADATLIPTSHQQYYTEKVAYLPSFQANDTKRLISDRKFSRDELGLPATGVVFCSFNNTPKINPSMFDSWMRILKQVEGSVLWMLGENETAINNLKREAKLRGENESRIVFAKRETLPDYLARYRMADLFLDTLPFNAGTTASDALWAGLPVITQIGETFAGRMAASLLNAIQLPELITTTQANYEALAVELALNSEKLVEIKRKLADNRHTTPLFDIEYFTKHIEVAYTRMYERSQLGLMPDHIDTLQKAT